MRTLTLFIGAAVALFSMVAAADDGLQPGDASHESRQKFAHTVAVWTQSVIRDAEGWLAYRKRELATGLKRRPPISPEARAACEAEIKKIEGVMLDLRGKSYFAEPVLPYDLKVGSMGKFAGSVRVIEVIDNETSIVEGYVGADREKPAGSVVREPTWKPNMLMIVMEGIPTAGMRVGEIVDQDCLTTADPDGGRRLVKYFEVVEKRQNKLPNGESKPIFILSKMSGMDRGEPSVTAMIGIEREKLSPPKKKPASPPAEKN